MFRRNVRLEGDDKVVVGDVDWATSGHRKEDGETVEDVQWLNQNTSMRE